MGWKAFKDYFNVTHIVQIEEGKLYIGSPYVSELVVINIETGKVIPKNQSSFKDFLKKYYPAIAEASPEAIKDLLDQEDVFERSIEVYTFDYRTYDILTKYCEAVGYPNVTHDGCLMHDNTYYKDRCDAVAQAKESLAGQIEWRSERVEDLEKELLAAKSKLEYLKGLKVM